MAIEHTAAVGYFVLAACTIALSYRRGRSSVERTAERAVCSVALGVIISCKTSEALAAEINITFKENVRRRNSVIGVGSIRKADIRILACVYLEAERSYSIVVSCTNMPVRFCNSRICIRCSRRSLYLYACSACDSEQIIKGYNIAPRANIVNCC